MIPDDEILQIADSDGEGDIPFAVTEAMFDDKPVDPRYDLGIQIELSRTSIDPEDLD
jgi:hypothetical protein